jgi:hypothetical protein
VEWLRAITAFRKLPEILRTVRELKKKSGEPESTQTEDQPTS